MIKSQDKEADEGGVPMYHGATRNQASVQLDDGRLIETSCKQARESTTPATMMAECGSATRPWDELAVRLSWRAEPGG